MWFAKKWLLILGLISILVTVATGAHAYSTVAHDGASHLAMTNHRNWALITLGLFFIGGLLALKLPSNGLAGALLLVASVSMLVTAYKGGELVYRYGLGVMALPHTSTSHHAHDSSNHNDAHNEDISSKVNKPSTRESSDNDNASDIPKGDQTETNQSNDHHHDHSDHTH